MEFLYHHQIMPSYIVGDFDSASSKIRDYYREETDVPIREYNPVKDASDTEIAIRLAMTLGCESIPDSRRYRRTGGSFVGEYSVAVYSV